MDSGNAVYAETDRLGIHMIEALCYEKINHGVSMHGYRYVVQEAREVRHLMLLILAYFRLVQLLVRAGQGAEALELIERFENRFPATRRGPHFPSDEQRNVMKTRKTHMIKRLPMKIPA